MTTHTLSAVRLPRLAAIAAAAIGVTLLATGVTTSPAGARGIGIKELKIGYHGRCCATIPVRLKNGRWQFDVRDKVRFTLTLFAHSKRKRIRTIGMHTGSAYYTLYTGRKAWKVRISPLRFSLPIGKLSSHYREAAVRFCANKMRGRTKSALFKADVTFLFSLQRSGGGSANRNKSIPVYIRCII